MSENNEEQFVPRSDEELARLLESQLAAMRGQTGEQARIVPTVEEVSLDEIFGALLDDATNPIDIPVVTAPVSVAVVTPHFVEPDETQPISYVSQSVDETLTVEEVVVDGDIVGELVIDELVVATTISSSATSIPVPSMFSEAEYIAAVLDEPVDSVVEFVRESAVETSFESVVEAVVEPVAAAAVVADLPTALPNATNPIVTFEPRPSFDELVFGVSSDD
jgi:hypothetical protein